MLDINWSDVMSILELIRPYLIAAAVVLVLAVVVIIAVKRVKEPKRYLIRSQSRVAAVIAIAVIVNLICTGPMSTLLTLVSGSGTITEETQAEALALGEQIAGEGIVLLKNEDNILPMEDTKNLNVFGWAASNPVYGGTGSGAMSDAYEIVDLETGLKNAGFSVNEDILDFYREYKSEEYDASRPSVGMWEQDWTLPEPPIETYPDGMIDKAKEFSDTAVVVIARSGGEHIDLPYDVSQVTYKDNSDDYEDFPAGTHWLTLSQSERNMLETVCDNFEKVIVISNSANTMELGFINEYEPIKGALWCPSPGQNGFNALGQIMAGEVNPSGRTADTFVADLTKTPAYNNLRSISMTIWRNSRLMRATSLCREHCRIL